MKQDGHEFTTLVYSPAGNILWIRLNRAEALNAFSTTSYRELRRAFRLFELNDELEIAIITGTGRAFATGGDLGEIANYLASQDPLEMYNFEDSLPFDTIRRSSKVIISAINGICVAGGLMLACFTDITVAARSATFGIPEGLVGLTESWTPALLLPRISIAKLKYLLLTGKSISAEEAERIGMITEVVEDADLEARAEEIAVEVLRTAPIARRDYKRHLDRLLPRGEAGDIYPAIRSDTVRSRIKTFFGRSDDSAL
jgi:enoyl-CoA hydratase/carnithine racemase